MRRQAMRKRRAYPRYRWTTLLSLDWPQQLSPRTLNDRFDHDSFQSRYCKTTFFAQINQSNFRRRQHWMTLLPSAWPELFPPKTLLEYLTVYDTTRTASTEDTATLPYFLQVDENSFRARNGWIALLSLHWPGQLASNKSPHFLETAWPHGMHVYTFG